MVGGANEDVTQNVVEVTQFEKREKLLEILRENAGKRTLVFVEQKRNADFLASMLSQSEFTTTSIHGYVCNPPPQADRHALSWLLSQTAIRIRLGTQHDDIGLLTIWDNEMESRIRNKAIIFQ